MGHIHVTTDNDTLLFGKPAQIRPECILPTHAVIQTLQLILRVGCIHGYQVILRIFQCDDPTLMVVLLDSHTIADADWFFLCKNRCPGISLFLRIIPILMVSRQIHLYLPGLKLGLLQAEKICIELCKILHKVFTHNGPKTVDIP